MVGNCGHTVPSQSAAKTLPAVSGKAFDWAGYSVAITTCHP